MDGWDQIPYLVSASALKTEPSSCTWVDGSRDGLRRAIEGADHEHTRSMASVA